VVFKRFEEKGIAQIYAGMNVGFEVLLIMARHEV
jgi:hypothetical protein